MKDVVDRNVSGHVIHHVLSVSCQLNLAVQAYDLRRLPINRKSWDRYVDYDSMQGEWFVWTVVVLLARKANNQNYWQDLLAKAFELVVYIA